MIKDVGAGPRACPGCKLFKVKTRPKTSFLRLFMLLTVLFAFLAPGALLAYEPLPPMPAIYYGIVKDANGQNVPLGTVKAYIEGNLRGEVSFSNGIYGQLEPPHENSLVVNGQQSDLGKPVTFKVTIGSKEYSAVANPSPVIFTSGVDARVDLTINITYNSLQGKVWLEKVKTGDPEPGTPGPYHSGTKVSLKQGENIIGSVVTANDGAYTFVNLPDGTYKLVFERAGWSKVISQDVVLSAGQSKTMPDLTLLIGDMNQDTYINVSDLLWMAQYIGQNPNTVPGAKIADVNRDGYVNVSDLLRVAVNIGKKPQI
ncbi:MAG TPA: hypothetical protein DD719_00520 [Desulfotomaculum sp.]|nr:hypothetical protein [Desulfotomaculum sp.]HCJ79727.1 hypothetical protein [Desulfotomaculum sp.]